MKFLPVRIKSLLQTVTVVSLSWLSSLKTNFFIKVFLDKVTSDFAKVSRADIVDMVEIIREWKN